MKNMKKIAIITSGHSRGSNFLAIHDYLKKQAIPIEIEYLVAFDQTAPVVQLAKERNIPIFFYEETDKKLNDFLIKTIKQNPVDLIVLAGFMRKLSRSFFLSINTPVVNIHPALLPKYGGKGMYGLNVHKAVFAAGEKVSGATVHFVTENYDEGEIIYQKECDISMCSSPEEIAKEVLKIEHEIYSRAICNLIYNC